MRVSIMRRHSQFWQYSDAGSSVARQGVIWRSLNFDGRLSMRTHDEARRRMKPRINGLKNLLRTHGHELILAAVLTLVAIVALLFSGFGIG